MVAKRTIWTMELLIMILLMHIIIFTGDVQYQIKLLSELTESLLDKESIKERVLDNMSGSRAQKETDIEIVK